MLKCALLAASVLSGALLAVARDAATFDRGELMFTRTAAAYPAGAPPGFSGGFGEQSCHACHFHAEPNTGPGKLTLSGVPERYVPGEAYTLNLTLARPGMKLAGFQLTARAKDTGMQGGTLATAPGQEERVGIETQSNIQYANQREKGTALTSPDTATWTLLWTAPRTNLPIAIHVAANAADADGTVEGDYIYTAVFEVPGPSLVGK